MSDYFFDQSPERRRLAALAVLHDADTFDHLARVGVSEGWHCLEIGTGGGSVARWLAARVGSTGRVVATDLEPRGLDDLVAAGIEVRRHDIGRQPMEERAFDLVYARAVLQHVPQRGDALRRMAAALRPGGVLLVEDPLPPHPAGYPAVPVWGRILAALEHQMRRGGADPYIGLQLASLFRELGLSNVDSAARVSLMHSGTPAAEFLTLTLEQVGHRLVEAGAVTAEEIAALTATFQSPGCTITNAIMIATWGTA